MSEANVKTIKKNPENLIIADQVVKILQDLIRIPSPSGKEGRIADYLEKFGEDHSLWTVQRDKIDNIYFIPNGCEDQELPILMAHSDTYWDGKNYPTPQDQAHLAKVEIVNKYTADGLICEYPDIQLGYDDKCGIAIILWLIENRPNLNFRAIITVQEERCFHDPSSYKPKEEPKYGRKGGCGIEYALKHNSKFFNSKWVLMLDRAEDKGENKNTDSREKIRLDLSDIIYWYDNQEMCSSKFRKEIEKISDNLGTLMRSVKSEAMADIFNINKKYPNINLVNLATGGYKEHSLKDYVNIFQVVRTLLVVEECIKRHAKVSKLAKAC